jgi:hypothetical protein
VLAAADDKFIKVSEALRLQPARLFKAKLLVEGEPAFHFELRTDLLDRTRGCRARLCCEDEDADQSQKRVRSGGLGASPLALKPELR